jgi:hypothetical protein
MMEAEELLFDFDRLNLNRLEIVLLQRIINLQLENAEMTVLCLKQQECIEELRENLQKQPEKVEAALIERLKTTAINCGPSGTCQLVNR